MAKDLPARAIDPAGGAMEIVSLPGTPLGVTRLGFGCAGLMARIDRRQSVALLRAAYGAGIRHFDTARLYGYGEAESALGDLIAEVGRDRLTVATKFGILPPRRTPILAAAKSMARLLASLHPAVRRQLRRKAEAMTRAGAFDLPTARASLLASLRALRTDHIDLLLLHECAPEDLTDELLRFLEEATRAGTIRAHGIATTPVHAAAILRLRPEFAPVVQTTGSAWAPAAATIAAPPDRRIALVTHSALGQPFEGLRARLTADAALARRWSTALGFDARDHSALAGLLLAAAAADNPDGAIVFGSSTPANIAANARAVGTARSIVDAAPRIAALHGLLRQDLAPHASPEMAHA